MRILSEQEIVIRYGGADSPVRRMDTTREPAMLALARLCSFANTRYNAGWTKTRMLVESTDGEGQLYTSQTYYL